MRTVAATPDLITRLVDQLAPADRARLMQLGGSAVLQDHLACSTTAWAGVDDDDGPVVIGGVRPMDHPHVGYVWQAITPAVRQHKRAYLAQGYAMHCRVLDAGQYWHLITAIRADYTAALRHVRRMGWVVGPPVADVGRMVRICERVLR